MLRSGHSKPSANTAVRHPQQVASLPQSTRNQLYVPEVSKANHLPEPHSGQFTHRELPRQRPSPLLNSPHLQLNPVPHTGMSVLCPSQFSSGFNTELQGSLLQPLRIVWGSDTRSGWMNGQTNQQHPAWNLGRQWSPEPRRHDAVPRANASPTAVHRLLALPPPTKEETSESVHTIILFELYIIIFYNFFAINT